MNTLAFNPIETVNKARDLLNRPERKTTGQALEEVDRAVNLLYARFNDLDDELALQVCGVIGLAIAKGSKNASKKKPKLSRWNLAAPPPVTRLSIAAERAGAVTLLKNLKGSWVASYAFINAAECEGDKTTTSALLKWIEAGSTTVCTLLGLTEFLTSLPKSSEKQIETIIKLTPSLFEMQPNGDSQAFGPALLGAVRSAITAMQSHKPYFGNANPVEALISACEKASSLDPQILFNPDTQNALGNALDAISKPGRTTAIALSKIGHRLLSLTAWHVNLHGFDASASILNMLSSIDKKLSLSTIAKKSADYSRLLTKPEPSSFQNRPISDINTLFASLLLAWENFSAKDSGNEVSVLIETISENLGFSRFGIEGQIVSFDPFKHFIDSEPTLNVVVVIPGITSIRADGSERVLVKAAVKSV